MLYIVVKISAYNSYSGFKIKPILETEIAHAAALNHLIIGQVVPFWVAAQVGAI